MYHVTKHYPHSLGLSAVFRQHRADSHCQYIHGYSLAFTFEFCAIELQDGWVIDFGNLKALKDWLIKTFDHRFLIAEDDPGLIRFSQLGLQPLLADFKVVPEIGIEAFAKLAWDNAAKILRTGGLTPRVQLAKVTVAEHEGNSASYSEPLRF